MKSKINSSYNMLFKNLIKSFTLIFILFLFKVNLQAQKFTHADTLRGTYESSRNWWDVTKYDLNVVFNIADSSIMGFNKIYFKKISNGELMQIDLQEPMILDSIVLNIHSNNKEVINSKLENKSISKDGNAYFFKASKILNNLINSFTVYYHGRPRVAVKPPWDGGIIWKKDINQNPFVSVACQGLGASVWYPCKDHQSDEPDSAEMHFTIPDSLICVSNGRLRNVVNNHDGTKTFIWAVVSPINNYNIIPYIGKYVNFKENYKGEKGNLSMSYWVLDYNLEKAKIQFLDAPKMMKAFEYWFGPYPFYEDGYKLVEAPHLGMEHQSATAYGNGFKNGYLGRDLSHTGWGLKWDFIIVHESGHEWFANNITTKDIADMWVHESFTNYSETLFTEYYYGKQAANEYVQGIRKNIANDVPIIAPYNVNKEGSGDMYYKGANMLHTIRQVINNDEKFRNILRGLNQVFYHQTVTGRQIQEYINKKSGINFDKVFDQYLTTTKVPTLEYKIENYSLEYRYIDCINGFNLPLKIFCKGERWIKPTTEWKSISFYPEGEMNFSLDKNFYINTKDVTHP